MQAGQLDRYMKLGNKKKLSSEELHQYRQFFAAVDSFDAKVSETPWDPHDPDHWKLQKHTRLLLRAEPQIGKTGEECLDAKNVFLTKAQSQLSACLIGISR